MTRVFLLAQRTRYCRLHRGGQKRYFSFASHEEIDRWKTNMLNRRPDVIAEVLTPSPLRDMATTLRNNRDSKFDAGTCVPPSWHHSYFHPYVEETELASDGYDRTYSPPSPYDQRLWAGSTLIFQKDNPLRVGQIAKEETKVTGVDVKHGIIYVTLQKGIYNEKGLSLVDKRTLVYMKEKPVPKPSLASEDHDAIKRVDPTPILLFRYSAVTGNSHMIHYDHLFATEKEGHKGIIVHGPLSSTLLLDFVRYLYPDRRVAEFSYRATLILFVNEPFFLCAREDRETEKVVAAWVTNTQGEQAIVGTVKFF